MSHLLWDPLKSRLENSLSWVGVAGMSTSSVGNRGVWGADRDPVSTGSSTRLVGLPLRFRLVATWTGLGLLSGLETGRNTLLPSSIGSGSNVRVSRIGMRTWTATDARGTSTTGFTGGGVYIQWTDRASTCRTTVWPSCPAPLDLALVCKWCGS